MQTKKKAAARAEENNSHDRKQQIINYAVRLFLKKGYADTSIRDIAGVCGISLPTMYYHVGSKENLLVLFREETEEAFIREVESRIIHIRDVAPCEALRYVIRLYVSYVMQNPRVTLFWYSQFNFLPETEQKSIIAMDERFIAILVEIIEKGVAAGEFKQLDYHVAANTTIFLCEMFAMRSGYLHDRISANEFAEFVAEFILSALKRSSDR